MKRLIFLLAAIGLMACSKSEATASEKTTETKTTPKEGRLIADGNSAGTNALIEKCGYGNEAPDVCGVDTGFQHIQQSYDSFLKAYVFDFYIHILTDNDRGIATITDRQRNEIKTDTKSPASTIAQKGETLHITWKFRLPEGMLTTANFCHLHQIKGIDNSAGTADVDMPLITFTARTKSLAQQLEVRYQAPSEIGTSSQELMKADLADFLGQWVTVDETVCCQDNGSYSLTIKRMSDNKLLISIPATTLNLWRTGSIGIRPKWGIYRSFGENGSLKSQLRDERVKFADFTIEKK